MNSACAARSLFAKLHGALAEIGATLREKHLSIGAKINMKNLFSLIPTSLLTRVSSVNCRRFHRRSVFHTRCSVLWRDMGEPRAEGDRTHLEEFHPACYSEYGYGYTSVNLARTQTQENDEYCSFRVILRPADLPAELRVKCFAEFDKDHREPDRRPELFLSGKDGFEMLSIKLYSHLLVTAVEQIGEDAIPVIAVALRKLTAGTALLLKRTSEEYSVLPDDVFIYENVPISRRYEERKIFGGVTISVERSLCGKRTSTSPLRSSSCSRKVE